MKYWEIIADNISKAGCSYALRSSRRSSTRSTETEELRVALAIPSGVDAQGTLNWDCLSKSRYVSFYYFGRGFECLSL
jgi:hypothetical protein